MADNTTAPRIEDFEILNKIKELSRGGTAIRLQDLSDDSRNIQKVIASLEELEKQGLVRIWGYGYDIKTNSIELPFNLRLEDASIKFYSSVNKLYNLFNMMEKYPDDSIKSVLQRLLQELRNSNAEIRKLTEEAEKNEKKCKSTIDELKKQFIEADIRAGIGEMTENKKKRIHESIQIEIDELEEEAAVYYRFLKGKVSPDDKKSIRRLELQNEITEVDIRKNIGDLSEAAYKNERKRIEKEMSELGEPDTTLTQAIEVILSSKEILKKLQGSNFITKDI